MTSESTTFDVMRFFTSVKGRLNRKPYNIALIIISLISLACYFIFVSENVDYTAILNITENSKSLCIEELNKKNLPSEISVFNTPLKECIKEKTLQKLRDSDPKSINPNPKSLLVLLIPLLLFLLMICPTIRRFHDRNKSGWWYLGFTLAGAIPYLNIIAGLWFLVETSFLRGTVGPNDYGPDPLA